MHKGIYGPKYRVKLWQHVEGLSSLYLVIWFKLEMWWSVSKNKEEKNNNWKLRGHSGP